MQRAGIAVTALPMARAISRSAGNLWSNGSALLTQVSGASATSSTVQNGYPSGTLTSYTIDNTGTIQGSFTNGQTVPIAQIALATFSNVQGLLRNGSNDYLSSLSSGAANIGVAGTAGRGTIQADRWNNPMPTSQRNFPN